MLVTADIAKGDPGNASIRYPLEVERPAAPAEDLDGLAASSDQQNRAFRDENLVLVDPRPDEDLIVRTCVFDGGAGPSIGGGIGRVHYQRVAAGRVGGGDPAAAARDSQQGAVGRGSYRPATCREALWARWRVPHNPMGPAPSVRPMVSGFCRVRRYSAGGSNPNKFARAATVYVIPALGLTTAIPASLNSVSTTRSRASR